MPISKANAKRYPKNWREISHRIRFVRAEGQCECQGECDQHPKGTRCEGRHGHKNTRTGGIICLTTAHLDHIPEHCDDSNLKAMCNSCHLSYDRHHHAANAKLTRQAKQQRIMDKSGQLAFEIQTGINR